MAPVIDARGLTHEYPDGTRAIEDVTLTIDSGERVAVVGPNGSGKSTLQLVLGGLVDSYSGTVRYFGETTDAESVRERLGVLLQNPEDYLFNTTVREDIEYGPAQLGCDRAETERRVEMLAAKLGLDDLLDRPPFRLSGGEKQRAAVASVFSFAPDVLLVDEPVGSVDTHYRNQILDILADHDGALLVFTPNLEIVPAVADRVLLLGRDGSIAADGGVRDVLTDQALLNAHGLSPPVPVRLFEGILDLEDVPLTVSRARDYLLNEEP